MNAVTIAEAKRIRCPFYSESMNVCVASLFRMNLDRYKAGQLCKKEDFDQCPMFLSKVLRRAF
jgi:hypothetical protein